MIRRRQPQQLATNKSMGAYFEKVFLHRAKLCGLLALKNELSFRYQGGGKMLPIRTDLDFRICTKNGQVGFFDLKAFAKDYFTYSQITPHQLQRARIYEQYNVTSGFVVWFKPSQQVCFFSGQCLFKHGPRSRFTSEQGLALGTLLSLDLRLIFTASDV